MHENIGNILNKGFNTWVRNLNICIPFILNFITTGVISFFVTAALIALLLVSSNGLDPTNVAPEELMSILWPAFKENLMIIVPGIFISGLLLMLVQAFFTAGAIGMAKEAARTGDTITSNLFRYGSKNAVRLFLVSFLVTLLLLAGVVFVVPGALAVGNLNALLGGTQEPSAKSIGLLAVGIIAWGIYALILSIAFSVAGYAAVIDELSPLEAVKTGFSFFLSNKLDVFLLWAISLALSLFNSYAQELLQGSESTIALFLISFISIAVILPLTTIWWTRLYLTRTGTKLYDPAELLTDPEKLYAA